MSCSAFSRAPLACAVAALAAVLSLSVAPNPAHAQAVPLPAGAGRTPAADEAAPPRAEPVAAPRESAHATPTTRSADNPRRTLTVNPSRPTYSDNADFIVRDWVEVEAGWAASFDGCSSVTTDPTTGEAILNDSTCSLQALQLLAKWSPRERQEYRVGWDAFGLFHAPGVDAVRGVGDPYVQAKFGIPLDVMEPERHRLAVLTELRPGFGQSPLTGDGLSLSAWAVYSTSPRDFQVHAQAGLRAVQIADDFGLQLPLSGVFGYSPFTDFVVFGEFLEVLQLTDLQASQTQLLAGAAWSPISSVTLDLSGGVGLTETVPAGLFQFGLTFLALPLR